MLNPKAIMIEFYGPTVRFGVEGKWVAWMTFEDLFMDAHRPAARKCAQSLSEKISEDQNFDALRRPTFNSMSWLACVGRGGRVPINPTRRAIPHDIVA